MRTIIRDNYTPKLGDYHERIVQDSVNDKAWLFDCDGVFTPLEAGAEEKEIEKAVETANEAIQIAESISGEVDAANAKANEAYNKADQVNILASTALANANDAKNVATEAEREVQGIVDTVSGLEADITAEAQARAEEDARKVDKEAGKGLSTNDFTNADKDKLDSAIQPENIDYNVMTDLKMTATPSTATVVLEGDKVNLKEGIPSDFEIPLPVASSSQAGVLNTATYDTILENSEKIEALEGGAVAISGLSATPTQAELSQAWRQATRLPSIINTASILDTDNNKEWTYYTNTNTWYESSVGGTITISHFTNTTAGSILGSNEDGRVHAETNGTGSVQGWDTVKADIANNTQAITTKVDKETGKGLSTNDFTTALKDKLDGIVAGAEPNPPLYSATGSNTDGAMTQASTTNALGEKVDKVAGKGLSTNDYTDEDKAALATKAVITMASVDPGEGQPLAANNFIAVYEV